MVCQLPEDVARHVLRACGLRELCRFSATSQIGARLASSGFEAIGRRRYPGLAVLAGDVPEQDWRALCRRARSIYRPLDTPSEFQPLDRKTALERINQEFKFVAEAFDGDPSDPTTTCLGAAPFELITFMYSRGELTALNGRFPDIPQAHERVQFLRLQVARVADQTFALLYACARTERFRGPNRIHEAGFLEDCAPWIWLSSSNDEYPGWIMAQFHDDDSIDDPPTGEVLFSFINRAAHMPYGPIPFEEVLFRIQHMVRYE